MPLAMVGIWKSLRQKVCSVDSKIVITNSKSSCLVEASIDLLTCIASRGGGICSQASSFEKNRPDKSLEKQCSLEMGHSKFSKEIIKWALAPPLGSVQTAFNEKTAGTIFINKNVFYVFLKVSTLKFVA